MSKNMNKNVSIKDKISDGHDHNLCIKEAMQNAELICNKKGITIYKDSQKSFRINLG